MNLDLPTVRRRSVISLTPLIDVVFILLLFFMLASNFSQERSVTLIAEPERVQQTQSSSLEASRIYLRASGVYALDGISLTEGSLLSELKSRGAVNASHSVVVSVSNDVDVQTLLTLIAQIKQTGVDNVVMDASGVP